MFIDGLYSIDVMLSKKVHGGCFFIAAQYVMDYVFCVLLYLN